MTILDILRNYTIDKNSPVPVYYQIQNIIYELIKNKKIKRGDKIPTEEELCNLFGVSRMTIRQALQNLVNMDILEREAGKGTFVSENKILIDISNLKSFSEDMTKRGFKVSNKVLDKNVIKADKYLADVFSIPEGEEIFYIKRLRFLDDTPAAIESSHILLKKCPNIINTDLANNSLFSILENEYKLKIDFSEQVIEPILSNEEESEFLNIKIGTPLLKMVGRTYLKSGEIIEYVIGIYRGDRYKLRLYPKRLK